MYLFEGQRFCSFFVGRNYCLLVDWGFGIGVQVCLDEYVVGMCFSYDNWFWEMLLKKLGDGYFKEEEKKCGFCQLFFDVYREEFVLGVEGFIYRLEWEI